MSNEEYEFVVSSIEFVAMYGQRFLPFYVFNWNKGSWKFRTNHFEETLQREKGCKYCTSVFTNALKGLHVKDNQSHTKKTVKYKSRDDTCYSKYTYYLEVARHIGNILPLFPSQSRFVPKDINVNDVVFRV